MTGSLMFERTNNSSCAFPFDKTSAACGKPYYKFYQLELRQLLLEDRSQHKPKSHGAENKRLVMERQRDRSKLQARSFDLEKVSVTGASTYKDSTSISAISSNAPNNNTASFKPKLTGKQKQPPSSSKRQYTRQKQSPIKPPRDFPSIEIDDDTDDHLPFSNQHSYTQVLSSSHDHNHDDDQLARQAMLKTIMTHFDACAPSNFSRWTFYRDFHLKISESTSPSVYQKFERIIL